MRLGRFFSRNSVVGKWKQEFRENVNGSRLESFPSLGGASLGTPAGESPQLHASEELYCVPLCLLISVVFCQDDEPESRTSYQSFYNIKYPICPLSYNPRSSRILEGHQRKLEPEKLESPFNFLYSGTAGSPVQQRVHSADRSGPESSFFEPTEHVFTLWFRAANHSFPIISPIKPTFWQESSSIYDNLERSPPSLSTFW